MSAEARAKALVRAMYIAEQLTIITKELQELAEASEWKEWVYFGAAADSTLDAVESLMTALKGPEEMLETASKEHKHK